MERAVLFFDIDGTLLSEITGTIPESATEALWAAEKAGRDSSADGGLTLPAETRCSCPTP